MVLEGSWRGIGEAYRVSSGRDIIAVGFCRGRLILSPHIMLLSLHSGSQCLNSGVGL